MLPSWLLGHSILSISFGRPLYVLFLLDSSLAWSSKFSPRCWEISHLLHSEAVYVHPRLWEDSYLTLPLLGHLFMSCLVFTFLFQWNLHMINVFLSQAKRFDGGNKKKINIKQILDGISSTDAEIQYAALLDLVHVSKFDYERRRQLYLNQEAWEIVFSKTTQIINSLTIELQDKSTTTSKNPSKLGSTWVRSFFALNSNGKSAELLFGRIQAVLWDFPALSNLLALAKSEDELETISATQSLPKALNSLLSCLVILDRV
uniref:Uncharacterized protein n=1 Tax=Vannella robusta TaxID=1487602 RepID=A0A7S4HXA7_9EUKA|mmetsp:Transcript_17116/g.21804  ORF Transcript_17116/g.21804 Transcript_17116/m.21804 type:complete len:260 (+) Transcript_17116:606-1385(+)